MKRITIIRIIILKTDTLGNGWDTILETYTLVIVATLLDVNSRALFSWRFGIKYDKSYARKIILLSEALSLYD